MSKFIVCVLVNLVILSAAFGQSPDKAQTGPDLKAQQELNKKALILLTETIQQSGQLKTRENQVLAKIALANLLWKHQEASARRLYREAFEIVREARDEVAEGDPDPFSIESNVFRFKAQLLQSIGAHDSEMAADLLRQIRNATRSDNTKNETAPGDTTSAPDDSVYEDTHVELALAIEAAEKKPEEALRVARNSLAEGYSYQLTSLLMKLAEKHHSMAGELAVEIGNKLRKSDFDASSEAGGIALFLVADAINSLQPPKTGETKEEGETSAPLLPQQFAREFLEFIVDAALKKESSRSGSYLIYNLKSMAEELEAVAPAPAARLKQRFAELDKETVKQSPEASAAARLQELSETNDVDAILENARTAPPSMRDSFYSQAATTAWENGDQARANEIATKNISNALERNRLLVNFQERALMAVIASEQFDQARQMIARTRSSERRVGQLLNLAVVLNQKNDKKGALELLNEAHDSLPVKAGNSTELELQLSVARAFSEVDVERSFALHTSAIDQISELMEAFAKVADFTHSPISIKDNEFEIESYRTVPGLGVLLSQEIKNLAETDFERTRRMFDRFPRPEIRVAAYLHMAQTILEPEEKRDCTCEEMLKKKKQQSRKQ